MAKINIVVDTDSDDMTVTVNGETMDNVSYICIDTYDDEPTVSITQVEKGDDLHKVTMTRAAEINGAKVFRSAKAKQKAEERESIMSFLVASRQKNKKL